jgi:hypothetical protein
MPYTSAFNELAGLRFEAAIEEAPKILLLVGLLFRAAIIMASSDFFKQWDLKFFAPASPPPRKPRQNSRPRAVPPRKPSSVASVASTWRKNE